MKQIMLRFYRIQILYSSKLVTYISEPIIRTYVIVFISVKVDTLL